MKNTPAGSAQPTKQQQTELKIIGAGFGRTGTSSFQAALGILGYNCYHMRETVKNKGHSQFWLNAALGMPVDWNFVFAKYDATCDWPSTPYYKELMAAYPHAKVILTTRDPEKWYKSMSDTIFMVSQAVPKPLFAGFLFPFITTQFTMIRTTLENDFGKGRFGDREHVIKVYRDHIAEVRHVVPKGKLLEFSVTEGWEPLCKFLGHPVPDVPFPNTNDTKMFQAVVWRMRVFIYTVDAVTAAALVGMIAYAVQKIRQG
ncbi:P-loop containing nucleoside triphosphate hydrolase protein [Chytriomyces sp. MP71]|nr:P-loop containing nucleoside triphosphate hydrolase protein [Chytriomyces sp. MP71]